MILNFFRTKYEEKNEVMINQRNKRGFIRFTLNRFDLFLYFEKRMLENRYRLQIVQKFLALFVSLIYS
jgi:hypothetical protein